MVSVRANFKFSLSHFGVRANHSSRRCFSPRRNFHRRKPNRMPSEYYHVELLRQFRLWHDWDNCMRASSCRGNYISGIIQIGGDKI